jgi:c-di-GMP-binding flagellar brake protein YcgR
MSSLPHVPDIADVGSMDLDRYRINSPREIEAILVKLAERATVVSLHIQDSPWFFLTTVITADRPSGMLLFEYGRDDDINMRVLNAREVRFDTYLDNINVRFSAANVKTSVLGGLPVFQCQFPTTLVRLQRREFFRISPPLNQPIELKVPLTMSIPAASTGDTGLQGDMNARGVDISCGGVVFLIEGNHANLPLGKVLRDVVLELPKTARLVADLEVRNVRYSATAGHSGTTRIGCKFSRIDSRALALLQRYINRIQVERRIDS